MNLKNDMYCDYIQTDIGFWIIKSDEKNLISIGYSAKNVTFKPNKNKITKETYHQLSQYFDKKLTKFDLPLDTTAYNPFYQSVWQEVCSIPYGRTVSYSHISNALNNPKALRAVGTANGKNPFPIIIPCHRVIGANGKMTGYAFGIEVKKWLLQHEGYLPTVMTLF